MSKKNGILIIDDEPAIIDFLQMILSEFGYTSYLAENGKMALEVLQSNKDEIEKIILDIKLPDIKGSALYYKIREISPDSRIIFSSGDILNGEMKSILKNENVFFIGKPYNIEQLLKILE